MKSEQQKDIRSASFRVLNGSPGHVVYGIWVSGAKCGDLCVRVEERIGFEQMLIRGGFKHNTL